MPLYVTLPFCTRSRCAVHAIPGCSAGGNTWPEIGEVVLFDYPYMLEGRKRPDFLPQLIAAHREALANARKQSGNPFVILVGKSMGSRIGCHVANQEQVAGLVCLGYPLCAAGNVTKLRDKVLKELRTPILFVQGTRDRPLPARSASPGAERNGRSDDASCGGRGRPFSGRCQTGSQGERETQEQVDRHILNAVREFTETVKDSSARKD